MSNGYVATFRHADAQDLQRPLTARGLNQASPVAAWLDRQSTDTL